MAICNFIAPNGEKSILAQGLEQKYGPDVATKLWTLARNQEEKFTQKDVNGEPVLSEVEKAFGEQHLPENSSALLETAPAAKVVATYKKTVSPEDLGVKLNKKNTIRSDKDTIVGKIKELYKTALANPTTLYTPPYKMYSWTAKLKNGYTAVEFANLIAAAGPMPTNVQFDPSIQQVINGLAINIAKEYKMEDQSSRELQNVDGKTMTQQKNEIFIPVLNEKGEQTGNFTSDRQHAAVSMVLRDTYLQILSDPTINPHRALYNVLKTMHEDVIDMKDDEESAQLAKDLTEVINSFSFDPKQGRSSIASLVISALGTYGITVQNSDQVLRALEIDKNALLTGGQPSQYVQMSIKPEGLTEGEDDAEGTTDDEGVKGVEGNMIRDYNDMVFELDPRDTASWRLKLFLSTLVDVNWAKNSEGKKYIKPVENYLQSPALADANDVYQKMLGLLADQEPNFNQYMKTLGENIDKMPVLQQVIDNLATRDESLRNEFVKVMSTHAAKYMMNTFNHVTKGDRHIYMLNPFEANRASRTQQMIKDWQEAQKLSTAIVEKNGERMVDTDRVNGKLMEHMNLFDYLYFNREKLHRGTEEGKAKEKWADDTIRSMGYDPQTFRSNLDFYAQRFVTKVLAFNGIEFDQDMAEDLFKNIKFYTKGTNLQGVFGFLSNGKPAGVMSVFIYKLAGKTHYADREDSDNMENMKEGDRTSVTFNNPLYTESTATNILAKIASAHRPLKTTGSHRTIEGKTVWDYILPTELTDKFNSLGLDDDARFNQTYEAAKEVKMTKYNYLLEHWKDNPIDRTKADIWYMDGLKSVWSKKGTVRADMSDREQILSTITMFQNRGKERAHYISLTHSDKTTTPVLNNFPRIKTGGATINQKTQAALYKIFQTEHERIRDHQGEDFNHRQYNTGKHLFFQMPEFNQEYLQEAVASGKLVNGRPLTQNDVDSLYNPDGTIADNINDRAKKMVTGMINNLIEDLTNSTLKEWTEAGVINRETNNYAFDRTYLKQMMKELDFSFNGKGDDKFWTDRNNNRLSNEQIFDAVTRAVAREYAINYFLVNTAMTQLVFGDPAQAVKAKSNQLDKKTGKVVPGQVRAVIDSTLIEYSKRLAKDIAPGQKFQWKEPRYQTVTLADVETAEKYLHSEELRKAYGKVDATDAQELTTVREHLAVAYASGVIQKDTYNDMMKIVDAGERSKDGWYEFTKPEHLAVIMQPMKPVYVGTRPAERGVEFHDYIKSSSYPLYPPMTRGLEIDHLRRAMEGGGEPLDRIDRVNFASAKKLGQGKVAAMAFNPDGTFNHDTLADGTWDAARQTLERRHFRIQQEVPYDETKEAIKTITQMNRLLVESISEVTTPFHVPGFDYEMNGTELRQLKEDIRKELINRNLKKFYEENGVVDGEIRDKNLILSRMEQEARDRGFSDNEIATLLYKTERDMSDPDNPIEAKLQIPLMFSTAAEKFESLMMSMVKHIAEVKMPGKSYVQASSVGYVARKDFRTIENLTEAQKAAIVFVEGFNAEQPLRTMQKDGNTVIPAQVLAPFNFLVDDGNGNQVKANIKDYLKEGTNTLDPNKIPKELLQLIGARIPNQGHSSMMAIEIVGFIPDNMGDLMIVPSAITKQMGADFDVDKLYTYKRPYTATDGGFSTDYFKEGRPSDNQLKTQYFDVHWAVLTHPEMYDKILKPLDKPDLEEEAKLLAPKVTGFNNFFHVGTQLSDFQSGKYAKQLVAQTSLSVTFNAFIQDKKLKLGRLVQEIDENGEDTGNKIEEPYFVVVHDEKGKPVSLNVLSGYGKSTYKGQTRTKSDNLTTIQSGAVDNAKTRVLNNLNLTPDTYKAAAALLMLETTDGKAVNLEYVTRLMTQPIIKEFTRLMATGNDSLSDSFQPNLKEYVLNQLHDRILAKANKNLPQYNDNMSEEEKQTYADSVQKFQDDLKSFVINPDTMLSEINNPTGPGQLALLNLFTDLDGIGTRLGELQSLFNQETNGAGQNLLMAMDKRSKFFTLDDYTSPIINEKSLYQNEDGDLTEQGNTFDSTVFTALNVGEQVFPYTAFSDFIEQTKRETLKPKMSVDNQEGIIRAMRSYIYSGTQSLWQNSSAERFRLMYNVEGGKSLAQRVAAAKNGWGKDNYFLQRLNPVIGDIGIGPDYLDFKAAQAATYDDNTSVVAFMQLLQSGDREQQLLGEDLVRYAYLTGGQADLNSFIAKVPISYLVDTAFAAELRDAEQHLSRHTNSIGFNIQYMQHNPANAVQIDERFFGKQPEGQLYPEAFTLKDEAEINKLLVTTDAVGTPKYVDFVHYRAKGEGNKIVLYMRRGGSYVRIDTLGNSFSDEYNAGVNFGVRSIFQENRALLNGFKYPSEAQKLDEQTEKLVKGSENPNPLVNWGMEEKTGDIDTANKMLTSLRADEEVPTALRTVSNILLSTNNNTIDTGAFHKIAGQNPAFSIAFGTGSSFTAFNNKVTLDSKVMTRELAAENFLHEMIHHRLSVILSLAGYAPNDAANAVLKEASEEFRKKNPETAAIVADLDRLRYEARQELKARLGDRFDQIEQEAKEKKFLSPDHELVYALSEVHEFASYVMTNKNVAGFLNEVTDSKHNKSIIQRVWDLLSDLLLSVAKRLGVTTLKHDGILKAALTQVLNLTNAGNGPLNINQAILSNQSMTFNTEREAKTYQQILENNYGKSVQVQNTGLNHVLSIKQAKASVVEEAFEVPAEIHRVIDKLKTQRLELEKVEYRLDSKNIEDRALIHNIYTRRKELGERIGELERTAQIKRVIDIGKEQLDWVESTLNKKNLKPQEIMVAFNTLDTWMDMVTTVYGKDEGIVTVDPDLNQVVARAGIIRQKLATHKARAAYIDLAKATFGVELTDKSFDDITDINVLKREFLHLSRTQRGVPATLAAFVMRSAENASEDISRLGTDLDKLEQQIKDAGFKSDSDRATLYKSFMQENADKTAWGIVRRYSPEWTAFTQQKARGLKAGLEATNGMEATKKKAERRRLYEKYWKDLRAEADFIDTRIFFHQNTGEKLEDGRQAKERARLVKVFGSEEHVDELMQKAQDLYKQYLEDRESKYYDIEQTTELTDEEIAAIPKSEDELKMSDTEYAKILEQKKKDMLEEKITRAKAEWRSWNSPTAFFDAKFDNNKDQGFGSDEYVVMAPRARFKKYYDEKYQQIQENPVKKKIYDHFITMRDKLVENLPEQVREKIGDDFLPAMTDELVNSMFSRLAMLNPKALRAATYIGTTVSKFQKEHQKENDDIPIKYIDYTKNIPTDPDAIARRAEKIASRSTDLPRILDVFGRMVYHYEHMSKVIDAVNIGETLLKEINKARLAEGDAKPIPNILEGVKFLKEALIFKNPKKIEGVSDYALYSDSPKKHNQLQKEVQTLTERQMELQTKYKDDDLTEPEREELDKINDRLNEIAESGRYLAASKVVDKMVTFTQLKALAYNPFAAVTNISFALISTLTHGNGRMDYNNKELWKAWKIMNHSFKNFILLGKEGDATAQKVRNIIERGNFLSEINDADYGKTNIRGRHDSGVKRAVKPNNWQYSGDYFTKGLLAVAMMMHKKVQVTENGENKSISLWDATGTDGYWDEEKYGENSEWSSQNVEEQSEWNKFKAKVKRVQLLIHGNQDKNAPIKGKASMWIRIFGQFRMSWLPEGIAARWLDEGDTPDPILGRAVKGRYKTMADLGFGTSAKLLIKQVLSALPGTKLNAFEGVKYGKGPKIGQAISEVDIENMRKNLAGIAFTIAFLTAILTLKYGIMPDDDEKKRRRRLGLPVNPPGVMLMMNMLTRNYQDLSMYSNTNVINTVMGSPAPLFATVNDSWKLVTAGTHLLSNDDKKGKKFRKALERNIPGLTNYTTKLESLTSNDISTFDR